MAIGKRREGQVFIIGAVIFTGLFLLAITPSGPSLADSSGSDFQEFFQQSLKESINAFNEAISEENSINNVKRGMYSYNRFMLESSSSKAIDFESYQLAVLPDKGESVLINYRDQDLKANLSINNDWTNTTIEPKQSLNKSFSSGTANVSLNLPNLDDTYDLTAKRPRLIYWMKMESGEESWQNSIVG